MDGYNPFDYRTGIYRSDLNFEMYWDDSAEKLQRMTSILNQADYIFISSNRQYATTVRVPERYPLTAAFLPAIDGMPGRFGYCPVLQCSEPGSISATSDLNL